MAYVAVSGGEEAIESSIQLLEYYRSNSQKDLELETIETKLSLLVDRVMSEAGLYSPRYAALALKQCEGSAEEAVFLLRAYRSTLKRSYDTKVADTANMRTFPWRRRTPPGFAAGCRQKSTPRSRFRWNPADGFQRS